MPRREDIKKVLVIGSGPIVIGQAAEFDYAGTQACLSLKEEGYEVILINSNPATIMTDSHIADKVYMEPLTLEYVSRIIRKERPDALLPSLGGQTGLNLAMQLASKGVLDECQCEILGTSFHSIEEAEDRLKFKELCQRINQPCLESHIARNIDDVVKCANAIKKCYHPDRINYGAYGDALGHLHFHLVPKYKDGFEWGGTFVMNTGKENYCSEEELTELINNIKNNWE